MKSFKLIITLVLLCTGVISAQWKTTTFPDSTETYQFIDTPGIFSEPGAKDQELVCRIINHESNNVFSIFLYKYGKFMAKTPEDSIVDLMLKLPSGEVIIFYDVTYSKLGCILVAEANYIKLMNILSKPDIYLFKIFNDDTKTEFITRLTLIKKQYKP